MRRFVPLLDLDPDLGEAIPPAELAAAHRLATVPVVGVPAGPCDVGVLESQTEDEPFAALVTDGLLIQNVELGERVAVQLIGPGDVVVPWGDGAQPPATGFMLTASQPARVAVLDRRLLLITRRWPQIAAALMLRAHQQSQRTAVQHAITQLSRVEDRVLATLWHLAQQWGTVTREGTVVSLALTHETIGRLVGARRPTVTLAVTALTAERLLVRRDDGSWLLSGPARAGDAVSAPHSDVVRVVAADVLEAAREEHAGMDREALLERICSLRESQERTAERLRRALQRADTSREAPGEARSHARSPLPARR